MDIPTNSEINVELTCNSFFNKKKSTKVSSNTLAANS